MNSKLLISLAALASASQMACNDSRSQPRHGVSQEGDFRNAATQPATATPPAAVPVTCAPSEIMAERNEAEAQSAAELLRTLSGKYELVEAHVYQRADTQDGRYVGAFRGRYDGRDSAPPFQKLTLECSEQAEGSDMPFFSGVTLPLANVIHAPSGRVTIFDEGSHLDNPRFNFPAIADLSFDFLGSASYKVVGKNANGPPYLDNRYISDVMALLSPDARAYRRTDGVDGFEIRFTSVEQRTFGGRTLKVTTSFVSIYGYGRY